MPAPPPLAQSPRSALADAVVTALNAQASTWGYEYTAVRRPLPILDPAELSGLEVYVIPGEREQTTSEADRGEIKLTVIVEQILPSTPDGIKATFDALDSLTTAIADYFRNAYQDTDWWCEKTTEDYDKAALFTWQEYYGYIELTFVQQH
jgi:hypothetical protein